MKNNNCFGIGIDVVDVQRFKKIPYKNHQSFYKKIFNSSEIKYCLRFKDSYRHFAGKFAAKEALVKSISKKIQLIDVKTDNSNSKPIVSVTGFHKCDFLVSISHERNLAVAVVISITR